MPFSLTGLVVAIAAIVAAAAFGLIRRARDGRLRPVRPDPDTAHRQLLSSLGVAPDAPLTLLQFSSQFCAPCNRARAVYAEVAGSLDGVRHVEVDVAVHPEVVDAWHIRRVPTLLVVDAAGEVVSRAVGVPTRERVLAAVAPHVIVSP